MYMPFIMIYQNLPYRRLSLYLICMMAHNIVITNIILIYCICLISDYYLIKRSISICRDVWMQECFAFPSWQCGCSRSRGHCVWLCHFSSAVWSKESICCISQRLQEYTSSAWRGKESSSQPHHVVLLLLQTYLLPWGVFTRSLSSNGLLFWLQYSAFQASCHSMVKELCNDRATEQAQVCVLCVCVYVICVCRRGPVRSECLLKSPPLVGEWPIVVRPLHMSKKMLHLKTRKSLRNNMVRGTDATQKQDWLCWRGPAAIYPTDCNKPGCTSFWNELLVLSNNYSCLKWAVNLLIQFTHILQNAYCCFLLN
jgi:hypothetical protein